MKVICLLLNRESDFPRLNALAEACLAFSPQVAVGQGTVFVEVGASHQLFTPEECIHRLRETLELLDISAKIALAGNASSAAAFARYGATSVDQLPVPALALFLSPFSPRPFEGVELFHKLGVESIGDFKKIPRSEIPARFGKSGLLAYEKLLSAGASLAWPRWQPPEELRERIDFDFAAQIHTFEPVLFLLKTAFQRMFLRLYARRKKLAAFEVRFHLNRFSGSGDRISRIALPLPQSEPKSVLALAAERLAKELEKQPLGDALEGITLLVTDTAPFHDTQRDFFTKAEEEREAWSSLVGRLHERLGSSQAFLAAPAPRLLPEASWAKTLDESDPGVCVPAPLRPLRLLDPPLRLERRGDWLMGDARRWRFTAFCGPEKLRGEWWLGGFEREYYNVETEQGETLWVFTAAAGSARELWLHGVYD